MLKRFYLVFAVFFVLYLSSCVSTVSIKKENTFKTPEQVEASWLKLNSYADTFDFFIEEPKAICHAVKIDLKSPNLKINPFPQAHSGPLYPAISASKLAENNDIVINTTPFAHRSNSISFRVPVGILQTYNLKYSAPNPKYCALAIYKTENSYSAKIVQSQGFIPEPEKEETILSIQGGFWQILKDGRQLDFIDNQDSRTACGLSKDGNTFYILVAEGEVKSQSIGLSFNQSGSVLQNLGCWNAMQFDGGSSTSLYINRRNVLKYPKNPILPAFLCFTSK